MGSQSQTRLSNFHFTQVIAEHRVELRATVGPPSYLYYAQQHAHVNPNLPVYTPYPLGTRILLSTPATLSLCCQ